MRNFGDLVARNGIPNSLAITDLSDYEAPVSLTYGSLQQEIARAAILISSLNIPKNKRIGILAKNSAQYLTIFFAIMSAGYVAVPINTKLPKQTVDYICSDAEIGFLIFDTPTEAIKPDGIEAVSVDAFVQLCAGVADGPRLDAYRSEDVEPDSDALFLYTSGSTGNPKGVPMTHEGQYWANDHFLPKRASIQAHNCLIAAPLYHKNGLWNSKVVLGMGGHIVLLPEFNPRSYLMAIADHHCTWLTSVPTMLALAVRESDLIKSLDFSHVSQVTMGSAPITMSLWDSVQEVFSNADLFNGYGTTEHGAVTFGDHPDGVERPPLSVGYPANGSDVVLAGPLAPDEGVLKVKSPVNMTGYHNLPEKTAERIADGWFDTGDVMRRDKNGFFFIVGRSDDMFICGGENIFPGQVEKIIEAHEAVAEACVVPVDYGVKGQAPFAFVVLNKEHALDAKEIKDHVLANAPAYSHPRGVMFIDKMPLIGTNKIDRKALAAQALQAMIS